MKIANIIYDLDQGGASIALKRINKTINLNKKIYSNIITYKKKDILSKIIDFIKFIIDKIFTKTLILFFKYNIKNTINFNLIDSHLLKKINNSNSNIINIHWIGNNSLSLNDIGRINKKVILTLHDMWPYTAIEHYVDEKYYKKYYSLNSKKRENFFLNFIFKKKIKFFRNISYVICTSQWQRNMLALSPVFKNTKKILIPLPLDFDKWIPIDKNNAKKKFKIKNNCFTILLPLSNIYANKRKGLNFLITVLEKIENIKICLITTNYKQINFKNKNITHVNINNIDDPKNLKAIYSMSDLFVMPSKYESFGQTLLEAQACNCPAVVFKNIGGEDLINHKINGYKANYQDVRDFKKGILWCYKKFYKKNNLFIRQQAKKKFSDKVISKKYKVFLNKIN